MKQRSKRDRDVHVFHALFANCDGRRLWVATHEGTILFAETTRAKAKKLAGTFAGDFKCDRVMHNSRTGRIAEKDSFGNDPKGRG